MTITVWEKWDSRDSQLGDDSETVELKFVVHGTLDDLAARDAIIQAAPALYANLVRQTIQLTPIGHLLWEAAVRYGKRKPPETGDSTYQFDTSGGTQHITQSINTVTKYAPPGHTAPDFKGAIGVTGDTVEGVDIVTSKQEFSETHYLPDQQITSQYKKLLAQLTGTVNNAPFRDYDAGEVLFLGAQGQKRGEEDWEITFKFAASLNATNITIGDITGIAKKGWEYLWVLYEDMEDTDAHRLVKRPVAVYIEQVYPYADFAQLGIGT